MSAMRRLVVILGPTASGKSMLAIRLAEKFSGEVVCCDSTQIYKYFDIGTGKVLLAQQRGITHHLMDIAKPDEVFTAGDYARRATEAIEAISANGNLPILTAGTGLYLRALLDGLADAPPRSEQLRERLREIHAKRGGTHLHLLLGRLDASAARRIAARDTQKVIRALEMRLLTGESVGAVHARRRRALVGYTVTKIGLLPSRAALYRRIDCRVIEMVSGGWADEVVRLKEIGVRREAKPFTFLGYSVILAHLEGRIQLSEAIKQIQQSTRRYAKRQLTWFRKEADVHWLNGFGSDEVIGQQAERLCSTAERE